MKLVGLQIQMAYLFHVIENDEILILLLSRIINCWLINGSQNGLFSSARTQVASLDA